MSLNLHTIIKETAYEQITIQDLLNIMHPIQKVGKGNKPGK